MYRFQMYVKASNWDGLETKKENNIYESICYVCDLDIKDLVRLLLGV